MGKLPIHTGESYGSSKAPKWLDKRPRRNPFFLRLLLAVCFITGYFWLIRWSRDSEWVQGHSLSDLIPDSFLHRPMEFTTQGDEHKQSSTDEYPATSSQANESIRIPLEAHIMSKCPDAQGCLHKLILPAMEQISDKVDFRLSFIASVSKETSDIQCMHGPAECIGNMLMLCAANLPFPATTDNSLLPKTYPRTPIIRSLGFANCLINDYTRIPDRGLVHQCALEHGIDFDALNQCASQQSDAPDDGQRGKTPLSGIALLRQNALHSERLDVHTSCTVRLDESVWCIHDGGVWKNCVQDGEGSKPQVLADEIKRLWEERN
ncbi:hypothetical protein N7466_002093 [Penicillium verhagenii]|uniref:uncharacterized protein n=1 Tax=Penicillium verhagenii TaxID=1562060 RepID=UPI0025450AB8|nr:uncharacterized protein N7466_002093 [Penicillium verhagenii]KAJ5938959.1 hypothetical protein N7466_002093 [Penicillium verhagenii]